MKKVRVTETCKIEAGTFYAGDERTVEDDVAGLLIGNGWALAIESVVLDVQGSTSKQKVDEVNG